MAGTADTGKPSPRVLVAVGAGGFAGTLARYGIEELLDPTALATLGVNLVGAFALGIVLGWAPWRRGVRAPKTSSAHAFFTTGVLGGFTTYSALALEVIELPLWQGAGYGIATVIAGVGLAAGGIGLGRRVAR